MCVFFFGRPTKSISFSFSAQTSLRCTNCPGKGGATLANAAPSCGFACFGITLQRLPPRSAARWEGRGRGEGAEQPPIGERVSVSVHVLCLCASLRPSQWRHRVGRGQTPTADSLLQQSLRFRFFCVSRVVVAVAVACVLLKEDPTWVRASRFFFFFCCCHFFFCLIFFYLVS